MHFSPDFRHFADVLQNKRPKRLPIYEHIVSPVVMEQVLDRQFAGLIDGDTKDRDEFFLTYCEFFRRMTYDVVSFEVCITEVVPEGGALKGGKPGPIQNRADFEAFPWQELPLLYWQQAGPRFESLEKNLPEGMKAAGGVGNGVFEISEDLVGLEFLPYMQVDDPKLYRDLFVRIGDLMHTIWAEFLRRHGSSFVCGRFGDDLGFKSSLLTNPVTVRDHIVPQYRRIVSLVHEAGLPFLFHSCGCIFEVMEDVIAIGIDAKHSNEDAVAPFIRWIDNYNDRIGLLGGFDMDFLCSSTPGEIRNAVATKGRTYRERARGYALGSGNSIPEYLPVDNYLALVEGANQIRAE